MMLAASHAVWPVTGVPCAGFGARVHITRDTFGALRDGRKVNAVRLQSPCGVCVRVIALGAAIQSVIVPDRNGQSADVALGYRCAADYLCNPHYMGVTIGRFAGRIAGGRLQLLHRRYRLPLNERGNTLHGGPGGFSTRLWDVESIHRTARHASVTFRYVSVDGEMGFPGTLVVSATYTLGLSGCLSVDYRATTDAPTLVNITNHAYWNLAGEGSGSVLGQVLRIRGSTYVPVDAVGIPTGARSSVRGGTFDFQTPKCIGRDLDDDAEPQLLQRGGYDHKWVVGNAPSARARVLARAMDPASGRALTLSSNQPAVQFYSGNAFDGAIPAKGAGRYTRYAGFALEPQLIAGSRDCTSSAEARLDPGNAYHNRIVYRFSSNGRSRMAQR